MEIDEEYLNAFLVDKGIRPAMLLQPADYKEAVSTDPISSGKLARIAAAFPGLVFSTIGGETLIAKRAYTKAEIPSNVAMGRILGYPCADDFSDLGEDRTGIQINVVLKSGQVFHLLAYFCRDESKVPEAVSFATAIKDEFLKDPRLSAIVDRVEARYNTYKGATYFMKLLLANAPFSEEDKHQLENHVWNLGLERVEGYEYNLENPIHRGIFIGLLCFCKYNPSEPFFPLQYRPENAAVMEITAKLDAQLRRIFAARGKKGGGYRKTRRRKAISK